MSVKIAAKAGVVIFALAMGLGSTVVVSVSDGRNCESGPPFLLTVTKLVSMLACPTPGRAIREDEPVLFISIPVLASPGTLVLAVIVASVMIEVIQVVADAAVVVIAVSAAVT